MTSGSQQGIIKMFIMALLFSVFPDTSISCYTIGQFTTEIYSILNIITEIIISQYFYY